MSHHEFVSVFDLFSIGIGPSSSHTIGPMRAAKAFLEKQKLSQIHRIQVDLYGSLALTGKGHGTDKAVLLGLEGERPKTIDPDSVAPILERIRSEKKLNLLRKHKIEFFEERDFLFHTEKSLPFHSNGMRFTTFDSEGKKLNEGVYYSIGGGFILSHEEAEKKEPAPPIQGIYPFVSGEELLELCSSKSCSIADIMLHNECQFRSKEEVFTALDQIWNVMQACVQRGCRTEGILPGGLEVKRRAPDLYSQLKQEKEAGHSDPSTPMDWLSLWALAVNEENAAGGKLVTAPTNGAAGIIPAVLHYYFEYVEGASQEGMREFLLTAAAIALLFKKGASLSAAEMGCQGEVGVACSMAAAGFAAVQGGTVLQVENAAEIGMEHNLGLTCDPVAGLVQIPCIERNTMGAIKAVNAARLALRGDGTHQVTLDQVIESMRQIGEDMHHKYKETSKGGLAVNVIEC